MKIPFCASLILATFMVCSSTLAQSGSNTGGPTTGVNATIDLTFFDAFAPTTAGTYMGHDSVASVTTLGADAFVTRKVWLTRRVWALGWWIHIPWPGGWDDMTPQAPNSTVVYTDPAIGAYTGILLPAAQYRAYFEITATSPAGSTTVNSESDFTID